MTGKRLTALALAVFIAGGVFAQEKGTDAVHKHQPFDILLGLNFGLGITPNIGDFFSLGDGGESSLNGNYAFTVDFGLTCDFYLFNWLSFNTGVLAHPDIYLIFSGDSSNVDSFTDIAATPLCLTIPLAAHVNIPKLEWLYAGFGLNFNIPIVSILNATGSMEGVDMKGDFFVSLPIDIGFDFVRPGRGGGRFFFRINPEFHPAGTAVPIGFIWQIYNWKIYGKK